MVTNKKTSKIKKSYFTDHLFLLKFVVIFFVEAVFVIILFLIPIISSHVISESSEMLFCISTISATTCSRIPNITFFAHIYS